ELARLLPPAALGARRRRWPRDGAGDTLNKLEEERREVPGNETRSSRSSRRVSWRRLWILAPVVVFGIAAGGPLSAAWWLTKAWPVFVGDGPAGLDCRSVEVSWAGGVMRGWLCDSQPAKGAVLLLHGWRGSRRCMLDRARFLAAAKYSVLIPDLPAHGESSG